MVLNVAMDSTVVHLIVTLQTYLLMLILQQCNNRYGVLYCKQDLYCLSVQRDALWNVYSWIWKKRQIANGSCNSENSKEWIKCWLVNKTWKALFCFTQEKKPLDACFSCPPSSVTWSPLPCHMTFVVCTTWIPVMMWLSSMAVVWHTWCCADEKEVSACKGNMNLSWRHLLVCIPYFWIPLMVRCWTFRSINKCK